MNTPNRRRGFGVIGPVYSDFLSTGGSIICHYMFQRVLKKNLMSPLHQCRLWSSGVETSIMWCLILIETTWVGNRSRTGNVCKLWTSCSRLCLGERLTCFEWCRCLSSQALSAHAHWCGLHVGEWHRCDPAEGAEDGQGANGRGTESFKVGVVR